MSDFESQSLAETSSSQKFFSEIAESIELLEGVSKDVKEKLVACVKQHAALQNKEQFLDGNPAVTAFFYAIASVINDINPNIKDHVREDPYGRKPGTTLTQSEKEICDWYKVTFATRRKYGV